MKIALQVLGREIIFTEEELTSIVENYLTSEVGKAELQIPREEQWFFVDCEKIDKSLFEDERDDRNQEVTRQIICEAFEELEKNPDKYLRFKTFIPKKNWEEESIEKIKKIAAKKGDHMADWVEQALEWAQRISNGESWERVCNFSDTTNWTRLVIWKEGHIKKIGGSKKSLCNASATYVSSVDLYYFDKVKNAVPLICSSAITA